LNLSEEQLALCKKYDAKSQKELYDCFKDKVLGLCRRYTSNKEEAKDVFQETFIRVFQRISQLSDLKDLEKWIARVSINTAINYFHKTKRHHYLEERNGYHHQDGEYELILSRFSDEMIIELINALPDGYRMVFNLYEVEGYSHSEISELLKISESTSRSQLARAKQVLKSKLKNLDMTKYEKSA
jgi:RNA polymerase sigma factor (sigma-70 family)